MEGSVAQPLPGPHGSLRRKGAAVKNHRINYTKVSEEGYQGHGWWAMGMARNDVILRQGQFASLDPTSDEVEDELWFSSDPELPDGLALDRETGTISGTPELVSGPQTYLIQATSAAGWTKTDHLKITVVTPPPNLDKNASVRCSLQKHIDPLKLLGDTWDPNLKLDFSCDPPLPKGLHLDTSGGELFGLPEGHAGTYTHTINCRGAYGFVAEIDITIEVLEKPSDLEYSKIVFAKSPEQKPVAADLVGKAFNLQCGDDVQLEPCPVRGSSPMTFSAESLPDSFRIDRATGVISGKAHRPLSGTWTIVASNEAGTCRTTIRVRMSDNRGSSPTLGMNNKVKQRPSSAFVKRPTVVDPEREALRFLVPNKRDQRAIVRLGEDGRRDPLFFRALLERERCRPEFQGEFARFKRRPEAEADWWTITGKEWENFLARQQNSCLHHDAKMRAGDKGQIFCRRCVLRNIDRQKAQQTLLNFGRCFVKLSRTKAAERIQQWWKEILAMKNAHAAPDSVAEVASPKSKGQNVFYHFKHERQIARPMFQPGELIKRVRAHAQPISGMCVDGMQELLFTASHDKSVGVWDPYSGKKLFTMAKENVQRKLIHTGNKTELVSEGVAHFKGLTTICSMDNLVVAWEAETGRGVRQYKGHLDVVTCIAAPRSKPYLVSGSEDGCVFIWDQPTAEVIRTLRDGTHGVGPVHAMSYQEGRVYAGYGLSRLRKKKEAAKGPVLGFDVETGAVTVRFSGHVGGVTGCQAVSDMGSQMLCTGGEDRVLRVWDPRVDGKEVMSLPGHKERVSCLTWSSSQHAVFSGSADMTVRGWDLRKGKQVAVLTAHKEAITAVTCWGQTLVSACQWGFIYTWSLGGLRELG